MISALGTQPNVKLFELMEVVLARYEVGCGNTCYTLEFVEALYLRTHYLLYSRQNGEEVWAAKSRMMSVAIAMGLHRDPSQWRMPAEIADRRRWLWWTLLSIERWESNIVVINEGGLADVLFPGGKSSFSVDRIQSQITISIPSFLDKPWTQHMTPCHTPHLSIFSSLQRSPAGSPTTRCH
jgi:hypothetical protein